MQESISKVPQTWALRKTAQVDNGQYRLIKGELFVMLWLQLIVEEVQSRRTPSAYQEHSAILAQWMRHYGLEMRF